MERKAGMIHLISAFWNALEVLCYFFLFSAFLKRVKDTAETIFVFAIMWIVFLLCSNTSLTNGIGQFIPICIAIVASLFLYKGKWYHHVLSALLCYILFAIVDAAVGYGMSMLRGISFAELIWQKNAYLAAVTIAKLIEVLTAWLLYRSRNRHSLDGITTNWFLLIMIFPVTSVIILVVVFYSFQDSPDLSAGAMIVSGVVGIANAAILYTISSIEKSTQREIEMDLLKQQMLLQTSNFESLEKNYRMQRHSVHEFEHHLLVLSDLLETNQMESAEEYLRQLKGNRSLRVFSVNSHHPVIDVILNQKYQLAQEREIQMHIQVNDLSKVAIQTEYLVIVLSNLLDNAIEACMRLPGNRQIICRILADKSLYLSVQNTSLQVSVENGVIQTTKDNRSEHGYGIPAIRYILDKMCAEYTFDYQNGWFQFVAELPLS